MENALQSDHPSLVSTRPSARALGRSWLLALIVVGCGAGDADLSEDPAGDSTAGVVTGCAGTFTIEHQQPTTCLPFAGSLWNKPIPRNVASNTRPDSDAIVQALFTHDGIGQHADSLPWKRKSSFRVVRRSAGGWDGGPPLYYGTAEDPVYVVASATSPAKGSHNPIGKKFHAPNGAAYNFSHSDNYINIWDQTTNQFFSAYMTFRRTGTWNKLPPCPGSGHVGTSADPCPADFRHAGVSTWLAADPDHVGGAASDSLPNNGWATHIRAKELMEGPIRHALFLFSECMNGQVFPGDRAHTSGVTPCSAGMTRAPFGALFYLDYTPTQLADLRTKVELWQYRILEALTVYGGYFGEASQGSVGGPSIPMVQRIEGPAAYDLKGIHYPLYDWLKTFHHATNNSQVSQSAAMACYSYEDFEGCEMNPYVGVPLYTGPSCPTHACDVSKHMHIAKECVALGLAGQPGGCL